MNHSTDQLRDFIDSIPTLAWSAAPDGFADSFNRRWLDYTGLTEETARGSGWKVAVHPDDLPGMVKAFGQSLEAGQPFEIEARLRVFWMFLQKPLPTWRAIRETGFSTKTLKQSHAQAHTWVTDDDRLWCAPLLVCKFL